MKTKLLFVSIRTFLFIVPLLVLTSGCYQPAYNQPAYGPYQAAPYGAPAPYGSPSPYGAQLPTSQLAPSISSTPNDPYYQPAPANTGNAPPFGASPSAPGPADSSNAVPRYNEPTSSNSPYFEQSNYPQNTFAPQEEQSVAQANFRSDNNRTASVEMTSESQFEAPVVTSRPQPQGFPAAAESQAQPMNNHAPGQFEVAAAPPLQDAKTPEASSGLEGTVRRDPQSNGWVLEFHSIGNGANSAAGRLPLVGSADVMQSLQEGKQYRLQGFIETSSSPTIPDRFHVQRFEAAQAAKSVSPFE